MITPTGRALIAIGLFGLAMDRLAGFEEFRIIAVMCGVLLALALLLLLAPVRVRAGLELRPSHSIAGEPGHGVVRIENRLPTRLNRPLIQVPMHDSALAFRAPVLYRGHPETVPFEIPPQPRGVHVLGPVGVRRTDPLGCFTLRTSWTGVEELWMRPRMVSLESLGGGWVRDLEGVPSDVVSMSDLSFHALREYVRGDDLRHVHWRSSARTGQLHVRQYHDTRRNHVVVIVDDRRSGYSDPEQYETALSIAASVVSRAALDDSDVTFACGPEVLTASAAEILDAMCLAEPGDTDLLGLAELTATQATDASQLVLICGPDAPAEDAAGALARFSEDVRFLGVRIDPAADATRNPVGADGLLRVGSLDAFPALLAISVNEAVT